MNCTTEQEIEEERRICYVGITRAKNKLYISNTESRFLFGAQSFMQPSRFIKEMSKELFKNISKGYTKLEVNPVKKSSFTVLDKPSEKKEKAKFAVGDKINHKAFGDGLVVKTDGEVITVAFKAPHGIKKLMGSHPAIRKL